MSVTPLSTRSQRSGSPSPSPRPSLDWSEVRLLRSEVVERLTAEIGERHVDESHRRELGRTVIATIVQEAGDRKVHKGRTPGAEEESQLRQALWDSVFGLGRLQPLLAEDVENVEINGADEVWVRLASGELRREDPVADSDEDLVAEINFLASQVGRSLTPSRPSLHMELADGSRLAAMIETTRRPHVVIRRHRLQSMGLGDLAERGMVSRSLGHILTAAVRGRCNILITGPQNCGKTTLVRALASMIPADQRWASVEQEYELHLDRLGRHPHVVAMQAREGGTETGPDGRPAGEVGLEQIIRDALRMNLSRIVVGEVRGPEVIPMLDAMTTGDGGSMATLHAHSASGAIERLVALCGRHGLGPDVAYRMLSDALDLIVHVNLQDDTWRGGSRLRYVAEVIALEPGEGGRPALTQLYTPGADGRAKATGHPAPIANALLRAGLQPHWLDAGNDHWRTLGAS